MQSKAKFFLWQFYKTIVSFGVGFVISLSLLGLRKFKDFQKYRKLINDSEIVYTISECQNIAPLNLNKYIYVQGTCIPYKGNSKHFVALKSFCKLNKQQHVNSYKVPTLQLLDHITQDSSNLIRVNLENIMIPDRMYKYNEQKIYRKTKLSFFKSILQRILPFINFQQQLVENLQTVEFGEHFIVLGELDQIEGSQYILKNILGISNNSVKDLLGALQKEYWSSILSVLIIFIIGSATTAMLYNFYQSVKVHNQPLQPQLQKSISSIMQCQNEEDACIICLTKVRSVIFEPCFHLLVCQECLNHIDNKKCPLCRCLIKKKVKIIFDK